MHQRPAQAGAVEIQQVTGLAKVERAPEQAFILVQARRRAPLKSTRFRAMGRPHSQPKTGARAKARRRWRLRTRRRYCARGGIQSAVTDPGVLLTEVGVELAALVEKCAVKLGRTLDRLTEIAAGNDAVASSGTRPAWSARCRQTRKTHPAAGAEPAGTPGNTAWR